MNGQRGFTLIEVVVTGIVSVVLSGIALSALYMANDQTDSGLLTLRLSQYSAVVTDQISRTTRGAFMVKSSGDVPGYIAPPYAEPFRGNEGSMVLCNRTGDTLGGYAIDAGGFLKELKHDLTGWAFQPFLIGKDTARIIAATSKFSMLTDRRGLDFRLHFYISKGGDTVKIPIHIEKVLCRNVDP